MGVRGGTGSGIWDAMALDGTKGGTGKNQLYRKYRQHWRRGTERRTPGETVEGRLGRLDVAKEIHARKIFGG